MIPLTLAQIASLVGGVVASGDQGIVVTAEAFVDSRRPVTGGLFAAIVGERVDGHEFAAAACAGGAAAVLASRPVAAPAVLVADVQAALGALARAVLERVPEVTVIGLTGSQGKTSTKDMLAEVLAATGPTIAPEGSLNTEIGVPMTALRVTPETRYLVAEMGARGIGHIAYLTEIVRPRVGLVLNVGMAHIGEFGSQDNIALAKGELVEALPPDGLAVLNADDHRVLSMAARTGARVLTFGTGEGADLRVEPLGLEGEGHPRLRLAWQGESAELTLGYVGAHHAMNAAGAAVVAVGCGLDLHDVADRLRRARPRSRWRMEVSTSPDGVLVINDSYNANPDSMRAALEALVDIARRRGRGRAVAVLGDMRELGESTRPEHQALGRFAARLGVDLLVAVGEEAATIAQGARLEADWSGRAETTGGEAEALGLLAGNLREGDVVLVKASRAAGLEGLAATLAAGRDAGARREVTG